MQDQDERIGQAIVDLLELNPLRPQIHNEDRYFTSWGDKTLKGLGASVQRAIEEATR